MPAHAGRSHKAALSKCRFQRLAINSSLLLLLPPPMYSSYPRTIERAVQIGRDNLTIVVQLAQDCSPLSPWYAGIRNENVESAIELPNGGLDSRRNSLEGGYVDLVRLACSPAPVSYAPQ